MTAFLFSRNQIFIYSVNSFKALPMRIIPSDILSSGILEKFILRVFAFLCVWKKRMFREQMQRCVPGTFRAAW